MVLVVDDDEGVREALAAALEDEGYEVATACDGREALDRLAAARPCIVLLDLMMPVVTGWEVFARMRASRTLADVPVCVISAGAGLSGSACYLRKPFRLNACSTSSPATATRAAEA